MNHTQHDRDQEDDAGLLAQLQALPSQRPPPPQIWERIAPALTDRSNVVALVPMRRRAWILPAAGLALDAAVAFVAIVPGIDRQAPPAAAPPALVTQAQAMTEQYQQAIAEVPVQQVPADLLPALGELDRNAQAIHAAIVQSPRSAFLLSQLQRSYAKRLQLKRVVRCLSDLVAVVACRAEVGGEHFDPAAGLAERGDVGSDTLTTERLRLTFAASDAGLGFLLGRGTCHVASCSGEVR